MNTDDVSVYLQCLEAIFALAEGSDDKSLRVINEKNVHYLIGMAIKHGTEGIYKKRISPLFLTMT